MNIRRFEEVAHEQTLRDLVKYYNGMFHANFESYSLVEIVRAPHKLEFMTRTMNGRIFRHKNIFLVFDYNHHQETARLIFKSHLDDDQIVELDNMFDSYTFEQSFMQLSHKVINLLAENSF